VIWLRFDKLREEFTTLKGSRDVSKQELRDAQGEIAPLEQEFAELQEQARRLDTRYKTLDQQNKQHQKDLQRQITKYENHDEAIEGDYADLHALDSRRAQLERVVQVNQDRVERLEAQAAECLSMDDIRAELEQAKADRKANMPQYEAAKREANQAQRVHKELEENAKRVQSKLIKLQDDKARRNERIFRQEPKLHEVYKWVDANRSQFRKEVWGPIMCEITPKSKNTAAYLENHVANYTLKSFVVQDKEDYDFLYNKIRKEMNLPISIVIVKPRQPKDRLYSEAKMEILKREHGVIGYMDESFEAPDAVVQALVTNSGIDKVLIGADKTEESMASKGLGQFLSEPLAGQTLCRPYALYASERDSSKRHTAVVSKYGDRNISMAMDDIRQAKWLAPGASDEQKQRVTTEFEELKQQLQEAGPAVKEAHRKMAELQHDAQTTSERIKEAKTKEDSLVKFRNKLANAQRKLKDSEEAMDVDDEEEKNTKITSLKKRVAHSITALEAHAEVHQRMMQTTYKCAGIRINKDKVAAEERRAK
jgi:chromosome segregation ATPase